jgi:perosamine synthetase
MVARAVEEYQQAFANWLGVGWAFAFWKGRVALYAILRALGVGAGDEVVVPGYTCVMVANPIKYLGAKPVYVDIEPATYNVDPALIEEKLTARTKVIIAQHTYGYPAAMDAIMEIADRKGLPVIEDCCLALGSRYKGQVVGTFGMAAYFSFQWNKPYTSGLGGMATTSDRDLAEKMDAICQQELGQPSHKQVAMLTAQWAVYRAFVYPETTAFTQNVFRWLTKRGLVVGSSSTAEFTPTMADNFFKGMSAVQARTGLRQLHKIEANIAHRRQMKRIYDELLAERGWPPAEIPAEMDPVLVRYPVRVADKSGALAMAARHFIELGSWFECPLHPIETPMVLYDYHTGMCPEAERASHQVVNLPMHLRANVKTIKRSVEFIAGVEPAE